MSPRAKKSAPAGSDGGTGILPVTPKMLAGAELIVGDETVQIVLSNPDDPVEKMVIVQRVHKVVAFALNDAVNRFARETKDLKPFEG